MGIEKGIRTYQLAVEERFTAFTTRLDGLAVRFSEADKNERTLLLSELQQSGKNLLDILPNKEHPHWLKNIHGASSLAFGQPNEKNCRMLMDTIWKQHGLVGPIDFSTDDLPLFDFDELFAQYRDQSKIGELFDALVDSLKQIIDSGLIDSLTVTTALQDLLSVLKSNRGGSLAAIKSSLFYGKYIKQFVVEVFKEVPVIKTFVVAFEKTLQEMEDEINSVESQMKQEVRRTILEAHPHIPQLAELKSKGALLLPAPDAGSSELNDESDQ